MNRCKKAREQAGLTVGQAAVMFGTTWYNINLIEDNPDRELPEWAIKEMPGVYGCTVEWLRGEGPDKDYEAVKAIKGSENLSFHDRDILAEFIASQGGRKQSP